MAVAKSLYNGVNETKDIFLGAKKHAKLSGKLLACALALNYPFKTQSISLIGFSLGCQVAKSCLKALHQLGLASAPSHLNIIQNVTLMGGAINFSGIEKERKWLRILSQTVPGQIRNVYSTKDYILLGYSLTHDCKGSAGRNHISFANAQGVTAGA